MRSNFVVYIGVPPIPGDAEENAMLKRRLLALHEACSHDAHSMFFFVFVGGSVVLSRLYHNDVTCLCSDLLPFWLLGKTKHISHAS